MGRVTFLPQELAGAQKGRGVLEFPTHHVGPLIEFEGQITVRLNPIGIRRVPVLKREETKCLRCEDERMAIAA